MHAHRYHLREIVPTYLKIDKTTTLLVDKHTLIKIIVLS